MRKETKRLHGWICLLALAALLVPSGANAGVTWPERWKVFLPVDRDAPALPAETLASIPERIVVEGEAIDGKWLPAEGAEHMAERDVEVKNVLLDLAQEFGGVQSGNTAYVFLPIESAQAGPATLGMGADWWMQAWMNGELIVDTTETGNGAWPPSVIDYTAEAQLREGRNVLAVRFVSGAGSSVLAVGGPQQVAALQEAEVLDDAFPPGPDPVQGLHAFMERQGVKPYDLHRMEGGVLRTQRLIFRDRQFCTQVWMLDNSPTVDHCITASVWPAWNANASVLYLRGRRPLEEGTGLAWHFNSDYSRMTPAADGRRPSWDREDPDVYYAHAGADGTLTRYNVRTGESALVAQWDPLPRERVYGFTADDRYVWLDTPNGGLWVGYDPPDPPIPRVGLYAGRPGGPPWPDGVPTLHGPLFGQSNVGRNPTVETDEWGPLIRIRVGYLIDRETGEIEKRIVPLSGNTEYLKTFMEGRIHFPQGGEWEGYVIHRSDDLDEMFQIYSYYPVKTHGHESRSPCGEYMAKDGGETRIIRIRDSEVRSFRLSPDGGNYHLHWVKHPRYFVAWVRGWRFGTLARPQNANIEFQVFSDGTFQPIVDTKHQFNGYYSGGDFSMFSPDATKIHYGSSMTGRFKNYVAVAARPRPPKGLSWSADGGAVALSWEPSDYTRETRGYLVYRGEQSGGPYALMTPEPVEETTWRDTAVQAGQPYYYVATSLEHSNLESGYSMEAARAGVNLPDDLDAPVVVYVEAEDAIRDLPTAAAPGLAMGADRLGASDWYYLYRHPEAEEGQAGLAVNIPVNSSYYIWARVRSMRPESASWTFGALEWSRFPLAFRTDSDEWTWVRGAGEAVGDDGRLILANGSPVGLMARRNVFFLSTSDANAQMDMLCFTTDPDFVPEGPRPENRTPPPVPANLRAENVRERVNVVSWVPSDDPALSHYQVYASVEAGFEPGQETLVASPTDAQFIDWGLMAGTRYYYAVTAVDRRGNESAPARAETATPPREAPPVEIQLAFAEAELSGPFERSEAGGLRGPAFVVPEDPDNNRVSWRVNIPREGEYYLWLRHLLRGRGGRGPDVVQNVRGLANGRRVATLGRGQTDLNLRDDLIAKDHPMASRVWTWAWPGEWNLEGTPLPAGEVEIVLENLARNVRYDVLLITDEPSFYPQDGRMRQR